MPFEILKDKVREDQNGDNPAQRADTVRYHCKLVAFLLSAVSKLSPCHKDKVREDQNGDNPAQRADTVRYHCKLVAFLLSAVSKLSPCHKTVKT